MFNFVSQRFTTMSGKATGKKTGELELAAMDFLTDLMADQEFYELLLMQNRSFMMSIADAEYLDMVIKKKTGWVIETKATSVETKFLPAASKSSKGSLKE